MAPHLLYRASPNQKARQKDPGSIPGLVEGWTLGAFFRNTVRGQGRQAVGLVSQCSIGGLKRTHTLVDESRLMSVLWSVDERF